MADQLKKLYRVSTIFSPIFFDRDIPVLTPGTIFHEKSLQQPLLLLVPHYIELIHFFWKIMHWKVHHKSHLHNQGEVMEFPGVYQRNSMWNFQGLINNEMEFPRMTKKKYQCGISWGFVFGLGISNGFNTILQDIHRG